MINIDEDNLKNGVLGLVLAVVEILRDALQNQAAPRLVTGAADALAIACPVRAPVDIGPQQPACGKGRLAGGLRRRLSVLLGRGGGLGRGAFRPQGALRSRGGARRRLPGRSVPAPGCTPEDSCEQHQQARCLARHSHEVAFPGKRSRQQRAGDYQSTWSM